MLAAGCRILATETDCGATALPELLDDLAAQGISTLMVEGGATVASSFLQEELVDRLALFQGAAAIGSSGGVAVPELHSHIARGFKLLHEYRFGDDRYSEYVRSL